LQNLKVYQQVEWYSWSITRHHSLQARLDSWWGHTSDLRNGVCGLFSLTLGVYWWAQENGLTTISNATKLFSAFCKC